MIKTEFELAERSIENKQPERYRKTIELYHDFVDRYPDSKFAKLAEEYYVKSINKLEKLVKG